MRNVRIFFKKKDRLKFTSHLDMNRFMTRMLRLSKMPIWYTEGFNPHPYLTFLLPLSLGFESDYEMMDIRILDDDYKNSEVLNAINSVLPEYIKAFSVSDAILKPGKIAFAKFEIVFSNYPSELPQQLSAFLMQEEIITNKTGKRGKVSTIDLAPKIKSFSVDVDNALKLTVVLPAGGADNVNPVLLLNAFGSLPYYKITRTMVFDANMNPFK